MWLDPNAQPMSTSPLCSTRADSLPMCGSSFVVRLVAEGSMPYVFAPCVAQRLWQIPTEIPCTASFESRRLAWSACGWKEPRWITCMLPSFVLCRSEPFVPHKERSV